MTHPSHIRNIAIIAHVDHGKTTLVDKLLKQSGAIDERKDMGHCIMDSGDLERERGITILAKNTSIEWKGHRVNIVDTPGHADFGGEVERTLNLVDAVILVVDSVDGPMPQTRFVTQKAFEQGLQPIVVINKIDRNGARPDAVLDEVFDLFVELGATDQQLDFKVIYASALEGFATLDPNIPTQHMHVLLDTLIESVPPPQVCEDGPFQMRVNALDYCAYRGAIGIGRVQRGFVSVGMPIVVIHADGTQAQTKITHILVNKGLERVDVSQAYAGDIVSITGPETMSISDTLCDPQSIEAMPLLRIEEPTVQMIFQVNTSPFAGRDGEWVTSRHLRTRLYKELRTNVALRVEDTEDADRFLVSGRGELHLAILIETMRREGYELSVAKPEVIMKTIDGVVMEPYEHLTLDVPLAHQGTIMEKINQRLGLLINLNANDTRVRLEYEIPTRGILGFRQEFLTLTSGFGLINALSAGYLPLKKGKLIRRNCGVLISNSLEKSTAYALYALQERGILMIHPQTEVYEGMIVGLHTRGQDLVVNVGKTKKLTNIRAAGSDENIVLTPPMILSLEQALEFMEDDELLEVTPKHLRLRKKYLKEHERKRTSRAS